MKYQDLKVGMRVRLKSRSSWQARRVDAPKQKAGRHYYGVVVSVRDISKEFAYDCRVNVFGLKGGYYDGMQYLFDAHEICEVKA